MRPATIHLLHSIDKIACNPYPGTQVVPPKLDLNKGMDAHAVHLVGLPCSSPWLMKRNPILLHPTSPLHHLPSKRVRELRAQGRGFGVPISDKKRRQEEDESIYNNNEGGEEEEDAIPQVVFNRMMGRAVFCVGFPMASGVGLLYLLSSIKEQRLWDVPGWLPFLSTLLAFGTSALGIAYGTLSTSWDPDKEGSLLGWEQVEKNWPELWREEENERR